MSPFASDHHPAHHAHPKLALALRIVGVACVVAVGFWLHDTLGDIKVLPAVQKVTLVTPNAPPPPPDVKPPEPEPEEQFEPQEAAAEEAAPIDDTLGVDAEGEGAGDSFGLVGKPGGRDITTLGGARSGSGSGDGLGRLLARTFALKLKRALEATLMAEPELRKKDYKATLALTVNGNGFITSANVVRSSGVPEIDQRIVQVLQAIPALDPPPADMAQPLRIIVNSRGSGRKARSAEDVG